MHLLRPRRPALGRAWRRASPPLCECNLELGDGERPPDGDLVLWALILFSVVSLLVLYAMQRLQGMLPFNPQGFGAVAPDLAFNAREWTEDCYTTSNEGRPDDARAWVWAGGCEARVVRGGSYASRPSAARSAARIEG